MNTKKLFSLALIIAGIGMIVGRPIELVSADSPKKVTICHATHSDIVHPYTQISVNDDAVDTYGNGNADHNRNDHQDGEDIIPPTYEDGSPGIWPSRNWDATGMAIWNNGCRVNNSTPTPTPSTTPSPSPSPTTTPEPNCEELENCEQEETLNMSSNVSCGEVNLRFSNYTPWFFSADYRVDSQTGSDDAYSNITIQNGPHAGTLFGQRFNIVDLLPGSTEQRTVNFTEDSGSHLVEYRIFRGAENDLYLDWESVNVESDCEENINPTPTPTPSTNNRSSLSTVDPSCDSDSISATHKIEENGKAIKGVRVVFEYNGEQKIAYTDQNGKAQISFKYTSDHHLNSKPDGFSSASHYITKETECSDTPSGSVLGASTQGQVLGATTYAETGIVEDVMMSILGLVGASMFTTGAALNVKNKS